MCLRGQCFAAHDKRAQVGRGVYDFLTKYKNNTSMIEPTAWLGAVDASCIVKFELVMLQMFGRLASNLPQGTVSKTFRESFLPSNLLH